MILQFSTKINILNSGSAYSLRVPVFELENVVNEFWKDILRT